MAVLLTYDVSGKNPEIKEIMFKRGYGQSWYHGNSTFTLPATTLWIEGFNYADTINDLRQVVTKINEQLPKEDHIKIVRAIAVAFDRNKGWSAEYGEPYEDTND